MHEEGVSSFQFADCRGIHSFVELFFRQGGDNDHDGGIAAFAGTGEAQARS